jgi:hypothetical protein
MTKTPSGRLIRNTQRQETASTSQPPTSGPIAPATPPRADQAPIARDRSRGTKTASMIASEPGVSSAPPIPWRMRAATSTSIDGASAHSADATVNQITPTWKTSRRP